MRKPISGLLESVTRLIEGKGIENMPDVDPDGKCPSCSGYGAVQTHDGIDECHCVKTARAKTMRQILSSKNKHIPNFGIRFSDIRKFPKFQPTAAYTACKQFAARIDLIPQALVLLGNHGRGKSLSMFAAMMDLGDRGLTSYVLDYPEFTRLYRHGFDGHDRTEKIMDLVESVDVVGIDEFGRSGGNVNEYDLIDSINRIVKRCEKRKQLIITSNFSTAEFMAAMPSYVQDRMNSSYATIITDNEKSLRGK